MKNNQNIVLDLKANCLKTIVRTAAETNGEALLKCSNNEGNEVIEVMPTKAKPFVSKKLIIAWKISHNETI